MKTLSIYTFSVMLMSCPLVSAQGNSSHVDLGAPPRVEIGSVMSFAKQEAIGNYYHLGGGGRVTMNFNRFVAAEAESTRQPTGNSYLGDEVHTSFAAKGTYRKEEARWLKFAGLNFFGVAALGFLNRSVAIAQPNPPTNCIRCTVLERQTKAIFDFGGGFELVPARPVSVRLDVTRAKFQQEIPYLPSPLQQTRVFLKAAIMFRFE